MIYSWIKIPFYPQNLLIIWLPIVIIAIVMQTIIILKNNQREKKNKNSTFKTNHLKIPFRFTTLLFIILFLLILYSFTIILTTAPVGWDAYAIYFPKAQTFYRDGNIESLKTNIYGNIIHPVYPNLYPLIETYLYYFMGSNNERVVSLIFPLIYSVTLILLIRLLKHLIGLTLSILTSILIGSLPVTLNYFTAMHGGYMDMPLAFTTAIGIAYGLLWLKEKKDIYLIFFILIMGCVAWTKNEGIPISLIWVGLFSIVLLSSPINLKRKLILCCILLISYSFFTLPWFFYKKILNITLPNIEPYLKISVFISKLSNIKRITEYVWEMLRTSGGFMGIWILFLLCTVFNIKKLYKMPYILLIIGLSCWVVTYFVILIIINNPLEWQLDTSANRLVFHFIPTLIIFISLCLKDIWDRYKSIEQNAEFKNL